MIEKVGKGTITVRVICDSISPSGKRITTFELEYQRLFHSEMMTHRMLSKNSASTRAIPVSRAIELMLERPAMPIHWGENNPGMQSKKELDGVKLSGAQDTWLAAMYEMIAFAKVLSDKDGINGHKQWVGRILEPFSFMKVVLTATEFANLKHLRRHRDAQPEFKELIDLLHECQEDSVPQLLLPGQWHLPYVDFDGKEYSLHGQVLTLDEARRISVSCCAQASYRRLNDSLDKANDIYDMLHLGEESEDPCHASPTEHQATPMDNDNIPFNPNTWEPGVSHVDRMGTLWSGNFAGWVQFRKTLKGEAVW